MPLLCFGFILFYFTESCASKVDDLKISKPSNPVNLENEIIYHIFLRSFYDSNGDRHGDLNGIRAKLDYLEDLGVNTILITPLYLSPFYHNYFPDDFYKIDPTYGSLEDYLELVDALHQRGMKLIMDMEIHYVTKEHEWFKDSFENPDSPYSEYIIYNGPDNTDPESIIWNLDTVETWDGKQVILATTDMYSQAVIDYHHQLFKYWVDPNGDGDFNDGVDGFRIDHMVDDLDWKNIRTDLLKKFWKPLFDSLRTINPNLIIMGEQGEWDFGIKYFEKGDVDLIFSFQLRNAFISFDKNSIINMADSTYRLRPEGKSEIIFLENHDLSRFATVVDRDPGKLKVGAALNILFKGVPSIYYGQELGMTGEFKKYGNTATNDIPRREAFEWYRTIEGEGMALWYKETGPWWEQTNLKPNDGISVDEQRGDGNSLWNFYKILISIRKDNPAIQSGELKFISNDQDQVLSFLRWNNNQRILVILNLEQNTIATNINFSEIIVPKHIKSIYEILTDVHLPMPVNSTELSINLKEFEIKILKL